MTQAENRSQSAVKAAPALSVSQERRWNDRQAMAAPVELTDRSGKPLVGTIRDMTQEGCMIELATGEAPALYSQFRLPVSGFFSVDAFVTWRKDNTAGLLFSMPVHSVVVRKMAAAFPASVAEGLVPR